MKNTPRDLSSAFRPPPSAFLGESWHAWIALGVGVLAISAHAMSSVVYAVIMKPMLAEFGWERTDFAAAMNLRMLVMIAAMPLAGLLTDRIGARFVLAAGAATVCVGTALLASVGSQRQLYPIMVLLGPGQAGLGAVAASALVLRLFRNRRGLAIGILNGGDNLINSTVPMVTAWVLGGWGWRAAFGVLASVFAALALLVLVALPRGAGGGEGDEGHGASRPRLRDLPWGDARLWLVCAVYACVYAFVTSVQFHFHAFQTDLGRSPAEASQLMSMMILVGAFGSPLFGWIAERTTARTALALVVAGLAATSVLLWTSQSFGAFAIWALTYGTVNSGVVAILALLFVELFGARQIGRLMGVAMVFCMSATMLGNYFSASMFDQFRTYVPAWQVYTGLMVLALVPVALLRRR